MHTYFLKNIDYLIFESVLLLPVFFFVCYNVVEKLKIEFLREVPSFEFCTLY